MSSAPLDQVTAIVLHGPQDLRVEHRSKVGPGPGECQVAIQSVGLCGSDLHYYMHGRNGDFALREPLVLGHEAAGIITAIGPNVSPLLGLTVGSRVAIECGKACGHQPSPQPLQSSRVDALNIPSRLSSRNSDTDDEGTAVSSEDCEDHTHDGDDAASDVDPEGDGCHYCSSGRYNLCEGMRFCSSAKTYPHLDGTLQTTMNHAAYLLHPLPDTCTYEQAALAEPLSVVLHAARRVNLISTPVAAQLTKTAVANFTRNPSGPKIRVLVIGAGAVGFLAAALARTLSDLGESYAHIAHISAMDIDQSKLDALRKAGYADATYTVPLLPRGPTPPSKEESLQRSKHIAYEALDSLAVNDRIAAKGYDVVFECTGVESCIQMAIYMARTGGKVALVGMGTPNPTIPLGAAALREVDLIGVFRYADTYPDALRLLASKTMTGIESAMVTQKFPLEQTAEAFKTIAKGKGDNGEMVLKVMVGPGYTK